DATLVICEGLVIMANAAAVQLFQAASTSDLQKKPLVDLILPNSAAPFERIIQGLPEDRRFPILEATFRALNEAALEAEVAVAPFIYNNKPAAHLVIRDISVRKRRERRLALQHATTRILSESNSFHEAAPQLLRTICENLGWDLGQFWMLDA